MNKLCCSTVNDCRCLLSFARLAPAAYIEPRLLPEVAVVLVDHTLGLLAEGRDGRVAPPLVQVSVAVIFATFFWKTASETSQSVSVAFAHRCCRSRASARVRRSHRWLRNSKTWKQKANGAVFSQRGLAVSACQRLNLTWDTLFPRRRASEVLQRGILKQKITVKQ